MAAIDSSGSPSGGQVSTGIVTLKVGELHRDEAELILDRVRAVDAGTLALTAARDQISEGVRRLRTAHASE